MNQRTSNRLMKHHQNESSPLSVLISAALTNIIATPKDAVCGIDKQGQVGCLILFMIIAVLLIDTCLPSCCHRSGDDICLANPEVDIIFHPVPFVPFCLCPWEEISHLCLQGKLQNAQAFLNVHTSVCKIFMQRVFLMQLWSICPRTQQLLDWSKCRVFLVRMHCLLF